jgi:hypothetical protein
MQFLKIGNKAIKCEAIEGITLYLDKVTVYTAHNEYAVYLNSVNDAEQAYEEAIAKLEAILS